MAYDAEGRVVEQTSATGFTTRFDYDPVRRTTLSDPDFNPLSVYTHDEHGGTITRQAAADYLDDGPEKPVRIWSRTGRRPVLAAGNSNGDIPMLDYTRHDNKPYLRLLVLHDDSECEFDYVAGAEQALERASNNGWTVVSVKNDWVKVF